MTMNRLLPLGFVCAFVLGWATAQAADSTDVTVLREKARTGTLTPAEQSQLDAAMKARAADRATAPSGDRGAGAAGRPTSRPTSTGTRPTGARPTGTTGRPTGATGRPTDATGRATGATGRPTSRPTPSGTRPAVPAGRPTSRDGKATAPTTPVVPK
jgi:hypothetical protein